MNTTSYLDCHGYNNFSLPGSEVDNLKKNIHTDLLQHLILFNALEGHKILKNENFYSLGNYPHCNGHQYVQFQ